MQFTRISFLFLIKKKTVQKLFITLQSISCYLRNNIMILLYAFIRMGTS